MFDYRLRIIAAVVVLVLHFIDVNNHNKKIDDYFGSVNNYRQSPLAIIGSIILVLSLLLPASPVE